MVYMVESEITIWKVRKSINSGNRKASVNATVKTLGWALGLVVASMAIGKWLGSAWYDSWWKWQSIPMPPVTRYILPLESVGYDDIRREMILWMTGFVAAIGWLILRRGTRMKRKQQTTLL